VAPGGSAARRYAEAVLDLATAAGAVDEHRASLERLASAFEPATLRAMRDPSVRMASRLAAAEAATAGQPGAIRGLVRLLLERDRIALIPGIVSAFGELVDERSGIAKAKVTTAVQVDQAERRRMVERLERTTGKRIEAALAVDPALLGGSLVQVGDRVEDASLRTRLDELRREMAS
jgi:F-type H+-transporting ATPase subunit delta